jgi:hypothetical protein
VLPLPAVLDEILIIVVKYKMSTRYPIVETLPVNKSHDCLVNSNIASSVKTIELPDVTNFASRTPSMERLLQEQDMWQLVQGVEVTKDTTARNVLMQTAIKSNIDRAICVPVSLVTPKSLWDYAENSSQPTNPMKCLKL